MKAFPLSGLFASVRGLLNRQPPEPGPAPQEVHADPSPAVADCVTAFDDGLRAAAKAWSSGALLPKVNPRRVERVLEVLASRETLAISALLVEIAAPDNAVSPVSTLTATNNVMREQFVRGVMGAVMAAIVDVEKAHRAGILQASALLDRTRDWIARPLYRQSPGPGSDVKELEAANDVLCRIASDVLEGSDEQSAAMVRVGMVGPLGVALQITKMLQETPRSVLGLQVAGFEFAAADAAAHAAGAADPAGAGVKS
ncbi:MULTISPECIES: hypothetical protein [unclassified Variovorax]|uniref:hypothetical protein n=1 Tax=unclassified Variovorax TaxID=663243 RepID=UPI00076CA4D4|nr:MULTISPECIES: hypothetical protein [unclassified Variovorax]KWT65026.1 hypothetical protein APY03_7479 [Variovorax sp. WDL1]PNG49106.1 hypothetical protein CHC06_06343 [Variovorax sp. B2]PNG49491.1 hypothetical protein CHC07_06400 [Variovorax sp. B4]VTV18877.1 hypothetical protein WDL1P2_00497 [Variovorax sp. WDL1]